MKIDLLPASLEHIPVVQNMARFYAYDLSKSCGFDSYYNWAFPENGLYEGLDISDYWEPNCYPFIIRVDGELGGFALINKTGCTQNIDWNMGEFFIVGKFQGKGIGRKIAVQLFDRFPGKWEVHQMPDNRPAFNFWKKIISDYTNHHFLETRKTILEPEPHDKIALTFKTA